MTVELILIRHGRPERIDHDPDGADPALTELGHRQAAGMAQFLADEDISALYVSPQLRAIETAKPLGEIHNHTPVIVDGIAEFDLGHPSYIPGEERRPMSSKDITELIRQATQPAFLDRVRTSTSQLIADHPGERIAAVCHGGVISVILNDILGTPIDTYHNSFYTSVTRIRSSEKRGRSIVSFNESHWLRDLT